MLMQEYDYDYQRVIDAENAYKEPSAPVLPESKKPYGKMIAAVIAYAVASSLASVVYSAISLVFTGGSVDFTSAFYQIGNVLLSLVTLGLYVLIPYLFAKSSYRTLRPRLAFIGCFYIQNVFSSVLWSVASVALGKTAVDLKASEFELHDVLRDGIVPVLLTAAAEVFQIAILIFAVNLMHHNGLFEEENTLRNGGADGYNRKAPVAAAVCAAVTVASSFAVGMLFTGFITEGSGFRRIIASAVPSAVKIAFVFVAYMSGKVFYKGKDSAILFTAVVTGVSSISFGGWAVNFLYTVVTVTVSAFTDRTVPILTDTAVSCLACVANMIFAALLGYFIIKRLNRRSEPTQTVQ